MTKNARTRLALEMRARKLTGAEVSRRTKMNVVTIYELANGWRRPTLARAMVVAESIGWPADRAAELFEIIPNEAVRDASDPTP